MFITYFAMVSTDYFCEENLRYDHNQLITKQGISRNIHVCWLVNSLLLILGTCTNWWINTIVRCFNNKPHFFMSCIIDICVVSWVIPSSTYSSYPTQETLLLFDAALWKYQIIVACQEPAITPPSGIIFHASFPLLLNDHWYLCSLSWPLTTSISSHNS